MKPGSNRDKGAKGEKIAVDYLRQHGYSIIIQNFTSKFGEIDIIAKEKDTLVFIEVKYRAGIEYGYPLESITQRKIKHIFNTAQLYIAKINWNNDIRFDVIEIIKQGDTYNIELIRNALELNT